MPETEYKSIEVKELTAEGQIQALISTFDQVDRDGDIMLADAFKGSNGKRIPMVWSHDWGDPIGSGTVSVQPDGAVFNGQFFMETARGLEAYKTVKAMGSLQEYSIGFRIANQTWENQDDGKGGTRYIRIIKDLELFEASPVLVGAAYGTRTIGIKGIETKAEWDTAYINNLPDSAFAVIEAGGTKDDEGKTTPRDLRKLPHHSEGGSVDVPHLRNALSREPQTDMPEADHAKAKAHLERHAQAEGIGTDEGGKALAAVLVALDHAEKAGAAISGANLRQVHSILGAAMSMHDASNCDMTGDCPMADMSKAAPPIPINALQRDKELRDLEAMLGYTPLIAGKA